MMDTDSTGDSQAALPPTYSFWHGTFIIHGSVLSRIMMDVLGFGVIALMTALLSRFVSRAYGIDLSIPSAPFQVAGAILGFLLVLRLNAGHDRWWEGRKLWGGIVNQSRNLAILGLAYGSNDHHWRVQFIKWVAAFPHTMRRFLRNESEVPELSRLLTNDDIERLMANAHMPNAVSKKIALLLNEVNGNPMSGFAFQEAERQRSLMIDHLGGCERILKTPLALSSAIQVRQFIFMFLIFLPFSLLNDVSEVSSQTSNSIHRIWLVPLFIMLLAYMLLALDRIGMELQNPFDVRRIDFLPLDEICIAIEKDLLELLHDDDLHHYVAPAVADVELPPDASAHSRSNNLATDIS
jgi:putative membrane protein